MNVDVQMGDSGTIPGSSRLVEELTDSALRGGRGRGKWLVISDVDRGEKVRFASNLTRGESSIGVDTCDNWDGDIGASSKSKAKKKERLVCMTV